MKKHNFNFPKIVSNFQDKVDIHVRTYRVKNGKVISPVDESLVNILPTVPGESFINKGTNQLYLNVCLGENDKSIEEKIAQKKEELTELLSINDPTKTQDQKNELLKIMDKILSDYRKELNMALTSQTLLEKQNSLGKNTNNSVNLSSVLNELGLA